MIESGPAIAEAPVKPPSAPPAEGNPAVPTAEVPTSPESVLPDEALPNADSAPTDAEAAAQPEVAEVDPLKELEEKLKLLSPEQFQVLNEGVNERLKQQAQQGEAEEQQAEARREADTPLESYEEVKLRLTNAQDGLMKLCIKKADEGRWEYANTPENRDKVKTRLIEEKKLEEGTDPETTNVQIEEELERRRNLTDAIEKLKLITQAEEEALQAIAKAREENGGSLSEEAGKTILDSFCKNEDGCYVLMKDGKVWKTIPNVDVIPSVLNMAGDLVLETETVDGKQKPTAEALLAQEQLKTLLPYLTPEKDAILPRTEIEMDASRRTNNALDASRRIQGVIFDAEGKKFTEGKTIAPDFQADALIYATTELNKAIDNLNAEKRKGEKADTAAIEKLQKHVNLLTESVTYRTLEWARENRIEFGDNETVQYVLKRVSGNDRYYKKQYAEGNKHLLKHYAAEKLKDALGPYVEKANVPQEQINMRVETFLNKANLGSMMYVVDLLGPLINADMNKPLQYSRVDKALNAITGEQGLISTEEATMIRMMHRASKLAEFRTAMAEKQGTMPDELIKPGEYFVNNAEAILRFATNNIKGPIDEEELNNFKEIIRAMAFADEKKLREMLKNRGGFGGKLLAFATFLTMIEKVFNEGYVDANERRN